LTTTDPQPTGERRGPKPGTARAALAHRDFRVMFTGAFLSNVGRWMQNVVLAAFAYELTGSPTFVGVVMFAQLGPQLLFSTLGGVLADSMDRRRLLLASQIEQTIFSFVLTWLAIGEDPNKVALVVTVFLVGVGQSMYAPAYTAVLPELVGRRDLPGAVSLNSAQMNACRVIGPAIGGVIYPAFGPAAVFLVNAVSYVFVIAALLRVTLPVLEPHRDEAKGLRRLLSGFTIAKADPLVRRILITLTTFSLFCLVFVGQMPVLAADNLDLDPRSFAYGALYAVFGVGAVAGAVSVGTVLAHRSRPRVVRAALLAFAAVLAAFALVRHPAPAYLLAAAVGFFYFCMLTSLSTLLQEHLDTRVRGRVMALWIMSFGGTVPVGNLVAGPIIDLTSITAVLLAGAVVAVVLSRYADLEALLPAPAGRR
jgi:MFS family permease